MIWSRSWLYRAWSPMSARACWTLAFSTLRRGAVAAARRRRTQSPGIQLKQSRRLRGGIAELETQLDGGELGRRPREQQVTVADRMQRAGAAKGAADFVAANRFADMMHHHQRGAGSVAQAQQGLAQRRHGARIVFVLIVRGIERVENDDLGGGGPRGGHEVVQSLRGAEQMAGGARVHQKILIGGRTQRSAHQGEAADELRDGQFELADEDSARRGDGKADAVRTGRERQRKIGDQRD